MVYNRNAARKIKSKFTTPRKGTGRREIIKLMLRPQGFGSYEIDNLPLKLNKTSFGKIIEAARDEYGFIVKVIGKVNAPRNKYKIFKIIGRYYWSGKIRYFKFNE